MLLNCIAYQNSSDPNYVTKQISQVATFKATVKDSEDVITPHLLINNLTVQQFNYFYIQEFGRYYFVEDKSVGINGVIEVDGKVDVLMSFSKEIKQCRAYISNQEYYYNLFNTQLNLPQSAQKRVQTQLFPLQPLNVLNYSIILATSGV